MPEEEMKGTSSSKHQVTAAFLHDLSFFKNNFIYLFYIWLLWVFVAARAFL